MLSQRSCASRFTRASPLLAGDDSTAYLILTGCEDDFASSTDYCICRTGSRWSSCYSKSSDDGKCDTKNSPNNSMEKNPAIASRTSPKLLAPGLSSQSLGHKSLACLRVPVFNFGVWPLAIPFSAVLPARCDVCRFIGRRRFVHRARSSRASMASSCLFSRDCSTLSSVR